MLAVRILCRKNPENRYPGSTFKCDFEPIQEIPGNTKFVWFSAGLRQRLIERYQTCEWNNVCLPLWWGRRVMK